MKSLTEYLNESAYPDAGMQRVNIVIGRFQPFTKGHLKCAEYAYKTTSLDTVLMVVETVKADARHPFLTKDIMQYLEKLVANKSNHIVDVVMVKNADIVKMSELCRERGYQIGAWTCGTDRIDAYSRMAERYRKEADLPMGFTMIEVPRNDKDVSATQVRNTIKDDDYDMYRELVPTEWADKTTFTKLKKQIDKVL